MDMDEAEASSPSNHPRHHRPPWPSLAPQGGRRLLAAVVGSAGRRRLSAGPPAGLAGSLGRSGRGAAKSSDPVGVAGRQKMLWVAYLKKQNRNLSTLRLEPMSPPSRIIFDTTEQHVLIER